MSYGIMNLLSLLYLTLATALVIGMVEEDNPEKVKDHVMGCWAKLLGGIVGLMLIIYVLSLFAGES